MLFMKEFVYGLEQKQKFTVTTGINQQLLGNISYICFLLELSHLAYVFYDQVSCVCKPIRIKIHGQRENKKESFTNLAPTLMF